MKRYISKEIIIISSVIIGIILFFLLIHNINLNSLAIVSSTYRTTNSCSYFLNSLGNPKALPFNWQYTSRTIRCVQSFAPSGAGCKIKYIKGECIIPKKASGYGQMYIYLASTKDSGISSAELTKFASSLKKYMNEASYGYLDNINFILESNANENNPKVTKSQIGTKIKGAYYLAKSYPTNAENFWENYDAKIPWFLSSALYKAPFPFAWTTIVSGNLDSTGCIEILSPGSTHNLCRETAHELAHSMFACDDNTGDIMRPTPEFPYTGHFPPVCITKIKKYIPNLVSK